MPTPSLLIVPARFKSGKMYSQIPTSGAGDFTVTRATTATRFGPDGLIASVASGIPRLDYYTSGGVVGCPALLVEPSAANGILNSTDTTTNWNLGANLTSGAIDVIGVTGNNISVAVSGSNIGVTAGCYSRFSNLITLTSGSTYTISFLIKKTGTHTIGGFLANTSGATSTAFGGAFDISGSFSSGSLIQTSPVTNRIRRVEQWGTDVYRCSETFTMTATNVLTTFRLGPTASVTDLTNSAVGTSMGFAAPQLELGPVPTSFIPTTTAAVTRNAEVITVSGAVSGSIGQTQGTVYAEFQADNASDEVFFVSRKSGAGSNRIPITKDSSNLLKVGLVANGSAIFTFGTSGSVTGMIKMALGYQAGSSALYVNGNFIASSTANFTFSAAGLADVTINKSSILTVGSILRPTMFRAIALYTTRLTNAQLASLTT